MSGERRFCINFAPIERMTKKEGGIYKTKASKRDVIKRLAEYENLGFEPEQLKWIIDNFIYIHSLKELEEDT